MGGGESTVTQPVNQTKRETFTVRTVGCVEFHIEPEPVIRALLGGRMIVVEDQWK